MKGLQQINDFSILITSVGFLSVFLGLLTLFFNNATCKVGIDPNCYGSVNLNSLFSACNNVANWFNFSVVFSGLLPSGINFPTCATNFINFFINFFVVMSNLVGAYPIMAIPFGLSILGILYVTLKNIFGVIGGLIP